MIDTLLTNDAFRIRRLEQSDIERSFRLVTQVFVDGSTLHRALNTALDEYRAYLWPSFQSMVSEELSVVAVDPIGGQIIGCLIVTEFRPDVLVNEGPDTNYAAIAALTSELVTRYSKKRRLGCGDAVLVDMGAVAPEAAGMGAYKAMRDWVNEVARGRGYRYILGELSSAITQHVVLDRMGHRKMAEVEFGRFEFLGGLPFSSISQPPSIVLSEGDLLSA